MRVIYLVLAVSVFAAPAVPDVFINTAQAAQANKSDVTVLRGAPFGLVTSKSEKSPHRSGFHRDLQNPGIFRSARQMKRLRKLKVTLIRGTAMEWSSRQSKAGQLPKATPPVLLNVKYSNEHNIKITMNPTGHIERDFQRYTGFKRQYAGPRYTGFRNDYFGPRYLIGYY